MGANEGAGLDLGIFGHTCQQTHGLIAAGDRQAAANIAVLVLTAIDAACNAAHGGSAGRCHIQVGGHVGIADVAGADTCSRTAEGAVCCLSHGHGAAGNGAAAQVALVDAGQHADVLGTGIGHHRHIGKAKITQLALVDSHEAQAAVGVAFDGEVGNGEVTAGQIAGKFRNGS